MSVRYPCTRLAAAHDLRAVNWQMVGSLGGESLKARYSCRIQSCSQRQCTICGDSPGMSPPGERCRPLSSVLCTLHVQQSGPGSDPGFQVKVLKIFQVIPSSIGSRTSPASQKATRQAVFLRAVGIPTPRSVVPWNFVNEPKVDNS